MIRTWKCASVGGQSCELSGSERSETGERPGDGRQAWNPSRSSMLVKSSRECQKKPCNFNHCRVFVFIRSINFYLDSVVLSPLCRQNRFFCSTNLGSLVLTRIISLSLIGIVYPAVCRYLFLYKSSKDSANWKCEDLSSLKGIRIPTNTSSSFEMCNWGAVYFQIAPVHYQVCKILRLVALVSVLNNQALWYPMSSCLQNKLSYLFHLFRIPSL